MESIVIVAFVVKIRHNNCSPAHPSDCRFSPLCLFRLLLVRQNLYNSSEMYVRTVQNLVVLLRCLLLCVGLVCGVPLSGPHRRKDRQTLFVFILQKGKIQSQHLVGLSLSNPLLDNM